MEFASGYLIELSLSIDNLFVFLLMFRSFGLDASAQRKALTLGIMGAIVMRGLFIFSGIALLQRFGWIQYIFGALLIVAALRLLRGEKTEAKSKSTQWISKAIARWQQSPKMVFLLVVLSIEVVDLVFALDSVPAVLAISHRPFVVYTSNIFAILGLRSLYFLIAGLLDRLRFLHIGLAVILGFVGAKMVLADWVHVPVGVSLGIIVVTVVAAATASLLSTRTAGHSRLAIGWVSVRKISVTTKLGQYVVSVGSGILHSLAAHIPPLDVSPQTLIFVLTSPEIWSLWGPTLEAALAPRHPVVLFLPAGERYKGMAQVERLATEMARAGADRSSLLIAFGGGVTGDVGGFLSAIYMRGIDYIQVPTTLLAQVDSSVGGKTGVNLQAGQKPGGLLLSTPGGHCRYRPAGYAGANAKCVLASMKASRPD